jgi:mannose-6-phosphate isomerase-like protein (cupin superfamily)
MNSILKKGKVVALVFMCLAGGIFVSGCSINHNDEHNCQKDAAATSAKVRVIDLADSSEYQRLLGGRPQTSGMRSGRVYLKQGETCGRHSTEQHEEMLVFLSGRGTALIGEEETSFEVGQGRICYIPPYTIHNIKNTGTEPLVYIYCVTPVQLGAEDHSEQHEHQH